MTHHNRQGQSQDPVKTGSDSFAARVASLPTSIRLRLLTNAGVSEAQFSGEQSVKDTDWGFATKVPAVQILLQQTDDQPCQSGTNINQPDSDYLAALRASRTFNCPDCVDAMAEAFGVAAAVSHLRGSVVSCQLSNDSQQETENKRQYLKNQLRLAWSGEAVKQGVAHAKKAEYDTALGCYKKALELDRQNVDAWVARGAAYANQHAFPKAISHFQTALEIQPGHVNANKYLRVTEQHMTQLGIPVFDTVPPSASSLKWTPNPHTEAEMSMPTQPAEQQPPQTLGEGQGAEPQQAAAPQGCSRDDMQRQASSSDGDALQPDMDLQKALKIVSKHYISRPRQKSSKSKHKHRKRKSHSHRSRSPDKHKAARRRSA